MISTFPRRRFRSVGDIVGAGGGTYFTTLAIAGHGNNDEDTSS
jgi:hypothetical protein